SPPFPYTTLFRSGLGKAREQLGETDLALVLDQDRQLARRGRFTQAARGLGERVARDDLDVQLLQAVSDSGQADEADAQSAHTGYMPRSANQVHGSFVVPGRAWKTGPMLHGRQRGEIMDITREEATARRRTFAQWAGAAYEPLLPMVARVDIDRRMREWTRRTPTFTIAWATGVTATI